MEKKSFSAEIGGKTLTLSTGQFAGQANGAVVVQYGETVLLATATMSKKLREGLDFFPLLVDFEERLYAAGKIKGSRFIKRDGRASEDALISARLIDRSIRPLFNHDMRNDVQIVVTVLSWDGENDADVLGLIGASAALTISNIPWSGPIGAVRVGQVGGEWVLNPTYAAREKSDLDLVLSANRDQHVMIEAEGKEVGEDVVLGGLDFAHKHVRKVIDLIEEMQKEVGHEKISIDTKSRTPEEQAAWDKLKSKVDAFTEGRLRQIWKIHNKMEREAAILQLTEELDQKLKADSEVSKEQRIDGKHLLEQMLDEDARKMVRATSS
jgi:polyribonucleotide nucleotidyltransferase